MRETLRFAVTRRGGEAVAWLATAPSVSAQPVLLGTTEFRAPSRLGDVEIGVPEGIAAFLDVSAKAGRVHNALDAAEAPEPSAETVEVRARTTAGSVVVRRP